MLSVNDLARDLPLTMPASFYGFTDLVGHRATVIAGLSLLGTLWGLKATGLETNIAVRVALIIAIEAAIIGLLLPNFARTRLAGCLALIGLAALATVSLLGFSGSPLAFVAGLLPPFWIGHTVSADQFGINARMAGVVGIALSLLPLTAAMGLNVMNRQHGHSALP